MRFYRFGVCGYWIGVRGRVGVRVWVGVGFGVRVSV